MRALTRALALLSVLGLSAVCVPAEPALATQAPVAFTSGALPTWQVGGIAWSVAQSGGKVFVGGRFGTIRPPGAAVGSSETVRGNLAVFDAATGSPTSCAPTVAPTTGIVRALAVSPDGATLYVGGTFTSVGGKARQNLAAIDLATCTVVSSFVPKPNATVRALAVTATSVFAGGDFVSVGSATRQRAAALAPVGAAGPGSVQAWHPALDSTVHALAVKPDGSAVVLGGLFTTVNGQSSHALGVVDLTGATVKAFPGFVPTLSSVKSIAVDATGFYTGNEGEGTGEFDGRIAVDWAGYAQRWRDTCLGATQSVVVYQGVLYVGSHAHDCAANGWFHDGPRNHLLAETTAGLGVTAWFPDTNDGLGEALGPRALVVANAADGDYLWVAGEFTSVNGSSQQGLTRFGQGTDTIGPSLPVVGVSSPAAGTARVVWRKALDTDDSTLTYTVLRDGSTVVQTVTADSSFWHRGQGTFTDTGLEPGSTHSYRVRVSDGTTTAITIAKSVVIATSTATYPARIAADGATSLWRYDEPGDVLVSDAVGSENLTLRGSAAPVEGAVVDDASAGISLPGTGFAYGEELVSPGPAFTLETWVKTSTTRGGKLIGFGNHQVIASTSFDRQLYMADDGTLLFGVFSGTRETIRSPKAYNDGVWHHVAATQDAGGMTLFVDGVGVAHDTAVSTAAYTGFWHVGGDSLQYWPAEPTSSSLAGVLDDTAVYPTALSQEAVAEHITLAGRTVAPGGGAPTDAYGQATAALDPLYYYRLDEPARGAAIDASGNGEAGSYGTGPTPGAPSVLLSGAAAAFPGTSAGTVVSDAARPVPESLSELVWFKTRTTQGGKLIGFGDKSTGSSDNYDRQVWMRDDGTLAFGVFAGGENVVLSSPRPYNDGGWHQVVATRSGTGLALYVDGAPVATSSMSAPLQSYYGFLRVGGDNLAFLDASASSQWFAGTLDEIAVVARGLTPSEVAANYDAADAPAPDTTGPTTPGTPTTTVTGGSVDLSWTGSTDPTGVVRYEIHRAATADGVPGTPLGTSTTTAFTDPSVPAGTWYYRIVAVDAAGNRSTPSGDGTATVVDAVPQVVSLVPVADAMASSAAPETTYGDTTTLGTRGSPRTTSYLRFALPALPPGRTLTSAVLRVRTGSTAARTSRDTTTVLRAADGWVESELTWNDRPAALGPLGSLVAPTQTATTYAIDLDLPAVSALLGRTGSLALTGTGSDDLVIGSRESSAVYRPQLVLTFT
jgi:hypothetical protein